jgi:ribonuclease III
MKNHPKLFDIYLAALKNHSGYKGKSGQRLITAFTHPTYSEEHCVESNLTALETRLGYKFNSRQQLMTALTHPTYSEEHHVKSNQRLEFLGDTVIELVVSQMLLEARPRAKEGELTKLRIRLTNGDFLAQLAREIGIEKYLRLGRGEEMQGGRDRNNNLNDAFEAVMGAILQDGGLQGVDTVLRKIIGSIDTRLGILPRRYVNPIGELQESMQKNAFPIPVYSKLGRVGPDHRPLFKMKVEIINGKFSKTGHGTSKKAAKEAAATAMLNLLDSQCETT